VPEPDSTERVYEGEVLGVTVERWGSAAREIVERRDAVAIVATDAQGRLVLVRQPREATRTTLVEIPAGVMDDGEEPLATAQRELAEETGLRGGRWEAGPRFYSTPGYSRERVHLFFATELEEGTASPDAGEEIEVLRWTREEVEARAGTLEDSKTLVGVLLWLRKRDG
jgi:ADP-ribose pyrophosphatase